MSRSRPKVAVVTWSVNHNPMARAHVLAGLAARHFEVEIVGFEFPAYGSGVWPPVRDGSIPVRNYAGSDLPAQLDLMEVVGRNLDADVVIVSKPRLPGVALGAIAKEARNRPLIMDADDFELSFVGADRAVNVLDVPAIESDETVRNPYGRIWTQVCDPMVAEGDACMVSNHTLRARYGGIVIPHARDEKLFDPRRFDRQAVRDRFGISSEMRLVLFGGTPRRHKGILEVAAAIAALNDPTVALCVIGFAELRELQRDLDRLGCPLVVLPPQPFDEMPALVAAADLTAVLQDPTSPVTAHQMPAKVMDALAMQVPCIVNTVPPLEPLIEGGHLEVVGPEGFAATLRRVLDDFGAVRAKAVANRDVFLEEFSHAAAAPRLRQLVDSALGSHGPLSESLAELLRLQRRMFGRPVVAAGGRPGPAVTQVLRPSRIPRHERGPYDLVVFWKQNDTGIYGRRHEMLLKRLAASDRVAQVVQFDAPLGLSQLRKMGTAGPMDQSGLVFDTTLRRALALEDEDHVHRYTFLFDDRGDRRDAPRRDQHLDFVGEVLQLHDIGQRPVVFWVYPTIADLPALIDRFKPDLVVADVVDDNRTWYAPDSATFKRLTQNYADVLGRSDVVFANCEAVQRSMLQFQSLVEVLPNALELPPDATVDGTSMPGPRPSELRDLEGSIIGYVGNLSSRIDIDLLDRVATSRRDWQIVLIGSTHLGTEVLRLAHHPNVHLLGPRRYEDVKKYINAFDVAIIPHLDNEMTRSMNPLKAFVYCSFGVPVVSTALANLDQLQDLMLVASDPQDFVEKIESALATGRRPLTATQHQTLLSNTWEVRADRALRIVDAHLFGGSRRNGQGAHSSHDGSFGGASRLSAHSDKTESGGSSR